MTKRSQVLGQIAGAWLNRRCLVKSQVRGQIAGAWSNRRCLVESQVRGQIAGAWGVTMSNNCSTIYIIAGPNGAGKTTFANRFLPKYVECSEFLNADLIAAGLSPFAPDSQNLRASELMLLRMRELLESRQTFSFETTLAARSYASHIPDWKSKGYCISLFFLWLPTVELAIERVANRVRQGGHNIMEHTIRQRYERGLLNFHNLYRPLVDEWMFLDGSALPPQEVARCREDRLAVTDPGVWEQFQDQAVGNRRNNDDRSDIE